MATEPATSARDLILAASERVAAARRELAAAEAEFDRALASATGTVPAFVASPAVGPHGQPLTVQDRIYATLNDGPKTVKQVSKLTGLAIKSVNWGLQSLRRRSKKVDRIGGGLWRQIKPSEEPPGAIEYKGQRLVPVRRRGVQVEIVRRRPRGSAAD